MEYVSGEKSSDKGTGDVLGTVFYKQDYEQVTPEQNLGCSGQSREKSTQEKGDTQGQGG